MSFSSFESPVRRWFSAVFDAPTPAQTQGWDAIGRGESTLILAPTGSGKTLAAFLWALDRLMFSPVPDARERCRVLYISPLKALGVDVERNLRAPLVGIAAAAAIERVPVHEPAIGVRTGDTPPRERARFLRAPPDILITTPESLFLMLTSNARTSLARVETVIVDEIHSLVATKRGAHLALSLERLEALVPRPLQRIGLSATQRPLDEVARFLGGVAQPGDRGGARARAVPVAKRRGRRAPGAPLPPATDASDAPAATPARTATTAGATAPGTPHSSEPATEPATEPAATPAVDIHDEFAAPARGGGRGAPRFRPVTIVDTGVRRPIQLTVEVAVEDMSRLGEVIDVASGPASATQRTSIWTAIHPRLVQLIRSHRSTLVFVNSRRLAERLAGAINELAQETLARSHHGSLAREQRLEIEDQLKAGKLPALVATSSLELGIDMGAIDLVVQIEAPSSVASGLQRIGRAGHRIDAVSEGIVIPKFRGDLLAAAAVAKLMREGKVEAQRYPRNPLDVLAQQIVAIVAIEETRDQDVYDLVRRAAPFESLSRQAFDGVLDMLSGRYPSDDFAELRPRLTWNRATGALQPRDGAKRLAIANAGTIPDRGLYGVFLAGSGGKGVRVGELDEEMVFEIKPGEVFVLGASSWRVDEVTHDRVLVTPAPGEPGKMPFWKGDRAGRSLELGLAIGALTRDLVRLPENVAVERLVAEHSLDRVAAENLVRYVRDQASSGAVPDAATVVVERVRDELGDWRVCVLSPRGGRVHAPWCMAVAARLRRERGVDVETMWGDDGFVVRLPDADTIPDAEWMLPDPEEVEALVLQQLGGTALFAARFRENAGRSLLLPKRRPGQRAPLWQQRKKAGDLLAVAARFGSFPVLLETYRECLRDIFDMPSLVDTLLQIRKRAVTVTVVDPDSPSPFAASLLFGYVANFLYDGDAPLAERRAQALSVDQSQLRELIGDAELRELLDAGEIAAVELQLQRLVPERRARSVDAVHDLLLEIGDLSADEIAARTEPAVAARAITELVAARRAVALPIAGTVRHVAVEDAARYRDALGAPMPQGIPQALRAPVADPVGDLVSRFARTHGPFVPADVAARFGLADARVREALAALVARGRVLEGEFRPGGTTREFVDANVLRQLRRRSLARLRKEVEAVEPAALGRFAVAWHTIGGRRAGPDALLDVIDQLQGAPLPASIFERDILGARLGSWSPDWLDTLAAAGEVRWVGVEPLGQHDGRIALYLTDQAPLLLPPANEQELPDDERVVHDYLRSHGASFFESVRAAAGGGFPAAIVDALWRLVWRGLVTNDTFAALRAYTRWRGSRLAATAGSGAATGSSAARAARRAAAAARANGDVAPSGAFRSRRTVPRTAEGRWTLVQPLGAGAASVSTTERMTHQVRQLLARHGVLTREALAAEGLKGGFTGIYPALRAMDDAGRVRRGYFVAGLGATQFALPGGLELLRSLREAPDDAHGVVVAATDPANPFGTSLPWPKPGPTRSVGAFVVIVDGELVVYVARGNRELTVSLPDEEPARSRRARAAAAALATWARGDGRGGRALLVQTVDGAPASQHPFAAFLDEAGFVAAGAGWFLRRPTPAGRATAPNAANGGVPHARPAPVAPSRGADATAHVDPDGDVDAGAGDDGDEVDLADAAADDADDADQADVATSQEPDDEAAADA